MKKSVYTKAQLPSEAYILSRSRTIAATLS
jgi:hypothetical protein